MHAACRRSRPSNRPIAHDLRRRAAAIGRAFALLFVGLWAAAAAWGQAAFPARAVRIVVPFAAGTPPDVTARVIGGKLSELWKQPVVIENKPGASGTVGIGEVARSPADGYTLTTLHFATATVSSLYPQAKLDFVNDFVPVGQLEWGHNILVVSPSLGVNTVGELVALLKKSPPSFASSGVGSPAHLSGLAFMKGNGIEGAHVPYNNFGQAIGDVATGRVTFMVLAAPAAVPQVLGGKLKALAVTGPKRNASLPDVPTVVEAGMPSMQSRTWTGLIARSGTPPEVLGELSRGIATVMAMPDVREQLTKLQSEVPTEDLAQFRAVVKRDSEDGARFVRENNLKAD